MNSLIPARRRAEEFAAVLDSGDTQVGLRDTELIEYAAIVAGLRSQETGPRAEFVLDLRGRLMAEADIALTQHDATLLPPVRQHGARERRLVAAASAIVLIGGTATIAAAAQESIPGEALYSVKRGIERAEAGPSMSDAGKGKDLLTQADARLGEVNGLLESDSLLSRPRIPGTLADFSTQAEQGSGLLFASFKQTQDPESVDAVRLFASAAMKQLTELAQVVPTDAQNELAEAAAMVQDIDEEATAVCGHLPGGPAPR